MLAEGSCQRQAGKPTCCPRLQRIASSLRHLKIGFVSVVVASCSPVPGSHAGFWENDAEAKST